jgi:hypothetical protein
MVVDHTSNKMSQALIKSNSSQHGFVQAICRSTRGIIFLDTPHYGMDAVLTRLIYTNRKVPKSLESDSEMLSYMRESFDLVAKGRGGTGPIDVTCFYAQLPVQGSDHVGQYMFISRI